VICIKLNFNNYLFIAFLVVLTYISYMILKPFIIVILSSFVIAFIFYPLYKKVHKKIRNENWCAFLISFLIIVIITVPTIFVVNTLTQEASGIYSDLTIKLSEDENLLEFGCDKDTTFCNAVNGINRNARVRFYVSGAVTNLASSITRNTSSILFSVPKRIIDLLIIFLLVFFLFKGGNSIWTLSKDLLPLKGENKFKLLGKFSDTINGVVYGYLVIAFVEAFLGWLAFFIVGSKIALLLGLIMGVMAMIPMIGAPIIWIPAAIIYFFSGGYGPVKALVLIVIGIIIAILDIWGRAEIIGKRTDIHPAVVALGVLGGIVTFGPVGVVIGPLVLSLLLTSIEIFQKETNSFKI
jgi:predicted PurR-regulated permease PerM